MKYPVDSLKTIISKAIEALPDVVQELADDNKTLLKPLSVREKKRKSLDRITDAERLWQQFGGRKVIALVGNVNAGKSSLGNFLLRRHPSEVFVEDDIRATAHAAVTDFGNDVMIDLPGLGSVLSEKDDQIVAQYIYRADLLIIVHHVGSDMDLALFEFLQKVSKNSREYGQRIIFVFNKTDTLAPASLERTLARYTKVLLDGDNKGFTGIRRLFNYELPMIPFSVFDSRNGLQSDEPLREAIRTAISASGGSSSEKNWIELKAITAEWDTVYKLAAELKAASEQCISGKLRLRNDLLEQLERTDIFKTNISLIHQRLGVIAKDAHIQLGSLPGPDFVEKQRNKLFGPGPKFRQKRDAFCNLRDSTIQSLENIYRDTMQEGVKNAYIIISTWYPGIAMPTVSGIDSSLLTSHQHLTQAITSQYLDRFFDGEHTPDEVHQKRVQQLLTGIESSYSSTLRSYKETIQGHIQQGYLLSLTQCKDLKAAAELLSLFHDQYQKAKTLINNTEHTVVQVSASAQESFSPSVGSPPTRESNQTVLWIFLVVILLIVLILIFQNS